MLLIVLTKLIKYWDAKMLVVFANGNALFSFTYGKPLYKARRRNFRPGTLSPTYNTRIMR